MHDNSLARALHRLGCDVQLIPTYTPIRTDEASIAQDDVFFGGINVFLQQKSAIFRWLPPWLDHWLSRPWLLDRVAGRGLETSARFLGELTVSMLEGEHGNQRKEVERLVDWLATHARPELVVVSNALIGGFIPALRRRLRVPVLITLQGDDLFLADLPEPYRARSIELVRQVASQADTLLVHSDFYAEHVAKFLGVDRGHFARVPLGIDTAAFRAPSATRTETTPPFTIGYLARICPPKGLHVLVDAFLKLRAMPGTESAKLRVAGWLGNADRPYFAEQCAKLSHLDEAAFQYAGVLDRAGKADFLAGLDVFSVPTTYQEPKGLYVLEALASGIPVIEPEHGAFPEMLSETGGGRLVPPNDPDRLAEAIHALLKQPDVRAELGNAGRQGVLATRDAEVAARRTLEVFKRYLRSGSIT